MAKKSGRLNRIGKYTIKDWLFGAAGLCLAVVSLYFPWHAYFHPESYSPPQISFSGNSEIFGEPEDRLPRTNSAALKPVDGDILDPLVTGTVTKDETGPASAAEQPFPEADLSYSVVFVANKRALIRDESGIFMIGVSSRLPDGSKVTSIRKTDRGWEVLTSENKVLLENK